MIPGRAKSRLELPWLPYPKDDHMYVINAHNFGSNAYRDAVLTDFPVGYWRLNDTSGTTCTDYSGNGLNGTYINSPTLNQSSPVSGGASVLFNGTTQYVEIPHNTLLNVTDLTMEIWCNFVTQSLTLQTVFGRSVSTSPTNVPYRIFDQLNSVSGSYFGTITNDAIITPRWTNEWRLLAFTVQNVSGTRTIRTYLNGVLQNTSSTTDAVPVRTSNLYIGAENNRRFVNARLAEAALYPTALSATRLLAHYNAAT
jgi:hypothetical protein